MISGIIIHFITCMTGALAVISTKTSFNYIMSYTQQNNSFYITYFGLNKFLALLPGTE